MQELKGKLGATAQFWLKYINMVETLYQLQFVVYKNNFLKLMVREKFLPLSYETNKVHYTRCGTFSESSLTQVH